jgi:hypothetical protein
LILAAFGGVTPRKQCIASSCTLCRAKQQAKIKQRQPDLRQYALDSPLISETWLPPMLPGFLMRSGFFMPVSDKDTGLNPARGPLLIARHRSCQRASNGGQRPIA